MSYLNSLKLTPEQEQDVKVAASDIHKLSREQDRIYEMLRRKLKLKRGTREEEVLYDIVFNDL